MGRFFHVCQVLATKVLGHLETVEDGGRGRNWTMAVGLIRKRVIMSDPGVS